MFHDRKTRPRNVALQPAFMHNGAFVRLEDAVRHHLDALRSARSYDLGELAGDLHGPLGPIDPVLKRIDPLLAHPLSLSESEFVQLVEFVRYGLVDPDAQPERLRPLIPHTLPSRRAVFEFQFR